MGKKIVVIGSINGDLVIEVESGPVMGQTVLGKNFVQVPGGKGANQAVACSRLGAETVIIGAIGDDDAGKEMAASLKSNGVCTANVKTVKGKPTGTAMIIVCAGDNYIAVDQGANLYVDKTQIDEAGQILRSADMVVLQLEIPLGTVKYAMEKCREFGVPTLLNPAPALAGLLTENIIGLASLLTPNETEAYALTGIMPSTPELAIEAARKLSDMGAGQVVITLGSEGAVYGSGSDFFLMPAVEVSSVVDTTAAGDSFTAALAVGLVEGKTLGDAVRFATKVGALTVTKKGAIPSLPYRNEVLEYSDLCNSLHSNTCNHYVS